jgi:hypothetical protein
MALVFDQDPGDDVFAHQQAAPLRYRFEHASESGKDQLNGRSSISETTIFTRTWLELGASGPGSAFDTSGGCRILLVHPMRILASRTLKID